MHHPQSQALQRFKRLLIEQQQLIAFLTEGQCSLNNSLQKFNMQQHPPIDDNFQSDLTEGRDFSVRKLGNGPYPWHWEGLGAFAQWESDEGALTYEDACSSAQRQLETLNLSQEDGVNTCFKTQVPNYLIPLPAICPFELDGDFTLEQADDGRWHWEGVIGTDCEDFCSEDGFASERFATADAIFQLSLLVDECNHEEAIFRVNQQGLPVHHLPEPEA